jgi:hypothetical protein
MSYYQQFDVVEQTLTSYCKNSVQRKWGPYFKSWLENEAGYDFCWAYQSTFGNQFRKYITPTINDTLWLVGKNVQLAIRAFLAYKVDASLEEVLDFTKKFITEQLRDFDNWCGELFVTMEYELCDEGPA